MNLVMNQIETMGQDRKKYLVCSLNMATTIVSLIPKNFLDELSFLK